MVENGLDPVDHVVGFDDVAGDQEQVGGRLAANVDDPIEVAALETTGEVEVAELDDLETIERGRQGGHDNLPFAQTEAERILARQVQKPGVFSGADQRVATFFESEVNRAGRAGDSRWAPAQREVERGERQDDGARDHTEDRITEERPGPVPEWVVEMHPEQTGGRNPECGEDPESDAVHEGFAITQAAGHVDQEHEVGYMPDRGRQNEQERDRPLPVIHLAVPCRANGLRSLTRPD